MANEATLSKLWKYKKQLKSCIDANDDDEILLLLLKIARLELTIEMIQETSIGKVINSMTLKEGAIGDKAKNLVSKWKQLVEERINQKYKSERQEMVKKEEPEVHQQKKQRTQHQQLKPNKSETKMKLDVPKSEPQEKPDLKRKKEIPNKCDPPSKRPSVVQPKHAEDVQNPDSAGEENGGRSFLDALSFQPPVKHSKKSTKTPNNSCLESDRLSMHHKSKSKASPGFNGDMKNTKNHKFLGGDSDNEDAEEDDEYGNCGYSMDVLEHLEDICSLIKSRKRLQTTAHSSSESDVGARKYASMTVFSGRKVENRDKNIPTFIDKFQQMLYENIDDVENIGNVPFEILEPVLRRCSPEQLEKFEQYNPSTVEKSDHLWKKHVLTQYPDQRPDEYGSWREVYLDNRDAIKAKFEQCLQKFTTNVTKMKESEHKTKFVDACRIRPGRGSARDAPLPVRVNPILHNRSKTIPLHKPPLMQRTLKMMKSSKH